MNLLAPAPDKCPICAIAHEPFEPHDAQSLYYQYRFFAAHGRWPTWADAIAHCSPEMEAAWERVLRKLGEWTEPEDGQPIADPPAESIRQVVTVGTVETVPLNRL